ncbi:MAG: energy transducer TonB [Sphingobacteriales bacterium]|nr:MAG: energy transducer TonB [Sphingobacteriales bacterium]
MDINKILNSDYLDILFEGRNKNYGGYELRKNYPKRVGRALMVLAAVGVFTAGYGIVSNIKPKESNKPVAIMKEVTLAEPPPIDPKKPPPPPPPSEPPPPVKPTVKFTPPVIKKDEEVKEDEKPPEQTEMKEAAAGIKTEVGDVNGIDPGIVDNPGTGTGIVEAPPPPEIFKFVEQMPEPPFDVNAYISKNLNYPAAARENNIEGRVTIQFVVSEDGSIGDAKVVGNKRHGGGLEDEAIRVVRSMPNWRPGKQNGRAVKVYFTLPISFKLQ